jgi:formylglycine-generating enzyme required for sulfatase activity
VAFGLLLLGIIIVIKYRGSDGKTTELSIEVGKTPEPSRGGATAPGGEAGTKPPVGLPARYKNSMGMEFALVPKGKFWMGGTGSNLDKAKEVEVPYDFYLGVYEVTQEEWQKVTGRNPSAFRGSGDARHAVKGLPDEEFKRFPVEQVSWDDAQLFLEVLNARAKESGWKYRLPKEAEWEYACRGGPASHKINYAFDFYLEKPSNELRPDQANFERNMNRTCKVGSYLPNQLGLYDMHGNVAEWCDDGENVAVGPSRRVLRGGYYRVEAFRCRAASRFLLPPATREAAQGLRLARIPSDLPGTATAPP